MVTLPTVPTFSAGAPSLAILNQLSYAASFIADCDVRPAFHLFRTSTVAIGAAAWTTVNFISNVAFDSDGMADGAGVTVVTQGYYALEGSAQFACTTSTVTVSAAFLLTGGGSNPHLATGITNRFGFRSDSTQNNTASADTAICCSDITPFACYPGDTIRLQVYCASALTLENNTASSYEKGKFVLNFTGRFIRTGT